MHAILNTHIAKDESGNLSRISTVVKDKQLNNHQFFYFLKLEIAKYYFAEIKFL